MARPNTNIAGKTFGKLTAINYVGKNKNNQSLWFCKCSCGGSKNIAIASLNRGHTKSCGCLYREARIRLSKIRPYEHIYNCLKRSAIARQLDLMSYQEFIKYVTIIRCHYCNTLVEFNKHCGAGERRTYNIDRKDNSVGYVTQNCVVCCTRCNKGKGNIFSYREWRKMTKCFREELRYERACRNNWS